MTNADETPAGENAWADARARYESSAEAVKSIAASLALAPARLVAEARARGWKLRTAGVKKPSTRAALMKLRETLQARIAQFEQQLAQLGQEVDTLGNEKEARAVNLLVRTLEKVLDLERKHKSLGKKQREHAKRLDDAAREELVRRIEALRPVGEGEAVRRGS
jgi:TolA-binding protein